MIQRGNKKWRLKNKIDYNVHCDKIVECTSLVHKKARLLEEEKEHKRIQKWNECKAKKEEQRRVLKLS